MTFDWTHFTPWASLAGGILLGLASALFILVNGRILGISGILGGLLRPVKGDTGWRLAFLAGLLAQHPQQPHRGGEHREGHQHLEARHPRARPRQRPRHRRPQAGRQIGQRHAQAQRGEYRQRLHGGQRDGQAQRGAHERRRTRGGHGHGQVEQDFDKCRLADTVQADQPENLAGAKVETNAAQHLVRAIGFMDILNGKRDGGHRATIAVMGCIMVRFI